MSRLRSDLSLGYSWEKCGNIGVNFVVFVLLGAPSLCLPHVFQINILLFQSFGMDEAETIDLMRSEAHEHMVFLLSDCFFYGLFFDPFLH